MPQVTLKEIIVRSRAALDSAIASVPNDKGATIIVDAPFEISTPIVVEKSNITIRSSSMDNVIKESASFSGTELLEIRAATLRCKISLRLEAISDGVDGIAIRDTAKFNVITSNYIELPASTTSSPIFLEGQNNFIDQNILNINASVTSPGKIRKAVTELDNVIGREAQATGGGGGGGATEFNGPANLSGDFVGDVIVDGDGTVTQNLTINGNLVITGDWINSGGFTVDIFGSVWVLGAMLFSPTSGAVGAVNIHGDLVVGEKTTSQSATFDIIHSFQFDPYIFLDEDVESQGVGPGSVVNWISGPNAGHTAIVNYVSFDVIEVDNPPPFDDFFGGSQLTIDVLKPQSIEMETFSTPSKLYVGKDVWATEISLQSQSTQQAQGNDIEIRGNLYNPQPVAPDIRDVQLITNGGNEQRAGDIIVKGIVYRRDIIANGGESTTDGVDGGRGGDIQLGGFFGKQDVRTDNFGQPTGFEPIESIISTRGGDQESNANGGADGGRGGHIFVDGLCVAERLESYGGRTIQNGGRGGNSGNVGISGNLITYTSSNLAAGSANLSTGEFGDGGWAGRFGVTGIFSGGVSKSGGQGRGNGRTAGRCEDSVFRSHVKGSISHWGGTGTDEATPGWADQVRVQGNFSAGNITMSGGDCNGTGNRDGAGTSSLSIDGGVDTSSSIGTFGGDAIGTGNGGRGGNVSVQGHVSLNGTISSFGGRANGSGRAGSGSDINIRGGCCARRIHLSDGTSGTTGVGTARVFFGGMCAVGELRVTDRPDLTIRPNSSSNANVVLKVGTFVGKSVLTNYNFSTPTHSGSQSSLTQTNIYSYDPIADRWVRHGGSVI